MPARPRRRLYLDTSAYLCLLLGEEGADQLAKDTGGAELLSSVLLLLEARRNLVRLARNGLLSAAHYQLCIDRLDDDQRHLALRDLTLDLCGSAVVPPIATPRSLDLAHLRTALWFHAEAPLTRFVTFDQVQAQAAVELGLPA